MTICKHCNPQEHALHTQQIGQIEFNPPRYSHPWHLREELDKLERRVAQLEEIVRLLNDRDNQGDD